MNFFGKDKKQDKLFVEIKNSFELIYWIAADVDHFVESYPEKINKKLLSIIFDNINKFNNFFNETLSKAESLSGIHKDCANLIKDYTKLSLEQFDFTKISNSSLEEKNDIHFLRLINAEAKFRDRYLYYLQKTDILVNCSNSSEGFPNIIGEAISNDCLCISSGIGEAKRILNYNNFFLFEYNQKYLENKILNILNTNNNELYKFKSDLKKDFFEKFSITKMIDRYNKIY